MEAIAMAQPSALIQTQSGMQSITVEPEMIQVLTVEQFIEKCLRFNEAHPGLGTPNIKVATDCPVHIYAGEVGNHTCKSVVGGYKECPLCHKFMCPKCHSHAITVVSRVTGYISTVSDNNGGHWGNGKLAEFKDRQRYTIGKNMH